MSLETQSAEARDLGRFDRFRTGSVWLASLCLIFVTGCLEEPAIEDRWTRMDIVEVTAPDGQELTPGATAVRVRAAVTYRSILTGTLVVELRRGNRAAFSDVDFSENVPREDVLLDVERLLAESSLESRATRFVTGFDKLIHELDFELSGAMPSSENESVFVLFYFGDAEEVEMGDEDVLVITPFDFEREQVLPTGVELRP